MLDGYEIICPECKGDGAIEHPDWTAFNQQYPRWWNMKPQPEPPRVPEEQDCGTCDGSGVVLTPQGKNLMDFIKRHL